MSLYEEKRLLKKLKSMGDVVTRCPEANRLKRKLIVRQVGYLFTVKYFMGTVVPVF